MELMKLMEKITDAKIPHFLILCGDEQTIIDTYIEKIEQVLNAKRIHCSSVSVVMNNCRKKSLDKSKRLYVVSRDMSFTKEEADVVRKVEETIGKQYLILRYSSLDERSSFFKKNTESIVKFSKLTRDVLLRYVYNLLPGLSEENAKSLIEYSDDDYGRLLMEIDKIKQYMQYLDTIPEKDLSVDDCFKDLDSQGLFYKPIGDITFGLTNAVLGGYAVDSVELLDEAKRKGEPPVMIASILYTGFRNLLAYQGLGKDKKGAMERTGLTKGEIYGCSRHIGGYSLAEVKRNMLFCQTVESGIKTGTIDSEIALEYLVLSCLK